MTLRLTPAAANFIFFHELPETESQHWSSLLKPHSVGALWSSQSYAAWRDIPSTYVVCEIDQAIPVGRQEEMIKNAREVQPKAVDVVERLETGHEPFLTKVDELVEIVERSVKGNAV